MHIKGKSAWIFTQSVLQKSKKCLKNPELLKQKSLWFRMSFLDRSVDCVSVLFFRAPVMVWHLLGRGGQLAPPTQYRHTHFYRPCSHRLRASVRFAKGHFYSCKIAKKSRISKTFWPNSNARICEVLSPRGCVSRGFAVLCPAPPVPPALQSPFMSIHPICSGSFLQP